MTPELRELYQQKVTAKAKLDTLRDSIFNRTSKVEPDVAIAEDVEVAKATDASFAAEREYKEAIERTAKIHDAATGLRYSPEIRRQLERAEAALREIARLNNDGHSLVLRDYGDIAKCAEAICEVLQRDEGGSA